jgi:hypothetical protein
MNAPNTAPNMLQDYIDRPELARQWNVSERTISNYERLADGLPYTELGGKHLYCIPTALAWLRRRERSPNPTNAARSATRTPTQVLHKPARRARRKPSQNATSAAMTKSERDGEMGINPGE